MKQNYPVLLNLDGRKIIVIGGGTIAERKVQGILETGAMVDVVSPDITEELKRLVSEKKITWKQKEFKKKDLEDAFIVIAATNNSNINKCVYDSILPHQLINIVDRPDLCSFHVPSVIRRGKLVITVSTSGASPSLAKRIRKDLEKTYDEKYESFVEFLDWARQLVLAEIEDAAMKKELLASLTEPSILTMRNRKEVFLGRLQQAKTK
ncbi:NAD(P)-binding protein [Anaerobacillus sp. MEB173]|uniref:NAD(P)-binding protein n=1 Tax=Anaerobacillus sp. MEB173 TaxID=3383345 RepID=UPI003F8F0EF8